MVDEATFEAFVAVSGPRLLRHATALTAGDHAAAEDLVQQALMRVVLRWDSVGHPVEPYARAVLINLSTDRWRRRQARVQELVGVLLPDHRDESAQSPFEGVELRNVLAGHLRSLPMKQRAVLVLRYFEDLSEIQIAEVLGLRPGTVKSTCSRALATLRNALQDPLIEETVP